MNTIKDKKKFDEFLRQLISKHKIEIIISSFSFLLIFIGIWHYEDIDLAISTILIFSDFFLFVLITSQIIGAILMMLAHDFKLNINKLFFYSILFSTLFILEIIYFGINRIILIHQKLWLIYTIWFVYLIIRILIPITIMIRKKK